MYKRIPLVVVMMTIGTVFVTPSLLFMPNQVTAASGSTASAGDALPSSSGAVVVQLQQHQLVEQQRTAARGRWQCSCKPRHRQTVMTMTVIETIIITTTITKTKNGIKDFTISTGIRINNTQFL